MSRGTPVIIAAFMVALTLAGCVSTDGPPEPPSTEQTGTPSQPVASFTWDPNPPLVEESVRFTGRLSPATPADEILWEFGDGTSSRQAEPLHAFRHAATYTVKLTVAGSGWSATHEEAVKVTTITGESSPLPPPTAVNATPLTPPEIQVTIKQNVASFSYSWDAEATAQTWTFGDGTKSTEPSPNHTFLSTGTFDVTLHVENLFDSGQAATQVEIEFVPYIPHVIVGIPDSGINPYHEIYYRPALVEPPCTYLQNFPCNLKELPLSVGKYSSWNEAYAADRELWDNLQVGEWYWIPQTVFVAVRCEGTTSATDTSGGGVCLLDDSSMHGTGTTSSVLTENPDALLVFVEGNAGGAGVIIDSGLPVDIISYSWGAAVPLAGVQVLGYDYDPFFVAASGNEGAFPVILDGTKSSPTIINVGGADGASRTEPGYSSWKTADFVSEYCRPTAQTNSISEMRERYCGTSFAAPTFAGALSRVIYELRMQSGYTGGLQNQMVDPILGISQWDVRAALNATASYTPDSPFESDSDGVPLVDAAPYYQWGWGYYARNEVPATMACLLEGICPERPADTVAYMELLWLYRTTAGDP